MRYHDPTIFTNWDGQTITLTPQKLLDYRFVQSLLFMDYSQTNQLRRKIEDVVHSLLSNQSMVEATIFSKGSEWTTGT